MRASHRQSTPPRLASAAQRVLVLAEESARTYYGRRYPDARIEVAVRLEQGSTRTWVKVTGAAALLIHAVAQYGSVRQGAEYLVKDAREFSDAIIHQLPATLGLQQQSPEVHRTRFGVPGQLRRLCSLVERGQLTAEEATRRALLLIEADADDLRREAPTLVDRLGREMEETAPTETRMSGVLEHIQADQTKLPWRERRRPSAIMKPLRPSIRRRGVVAARDDKTGHIQLRTYDLGDWLSASIVVGRRGGDVVARCMAPPTRRLAFDAVQHQSAG